MVPTTFQAMMTRYSWVNIAIGAISLLAGSIYYAVCRTEVPSLISYVLADPITPMSCVPYVGNTFPTLAHVFGFSLISVAFIGRKLRTVIACASLWFLINVFFEVISLFQETSLVSFVPARVAEIITAGTFDPYDITAAFTGALCAIFVAHIYPRGSANVI